MDLASWLSNQNQTFKQSFYCEGEEENHDVSHRRAERRRRVRDKSMRGEC